MNFDLVRPCANCPFRFDIRSYLTGERAEEIADALLAQQASFSCHKTNTFEESDDDVTETVETGDSQHCAGALIFLELQDSPNQLMRWMERIGVYDRSRLDMTAPVFDDADTFVEHHTRRGSP